MEPTQSLEVIKTTLSLELTKVGKGIQALSDKEMSLIYNEDNISKIKETLDDIQKAKDITEAKRKALKQPYWDAGVLVDSGAKVISSELSSLDAKIRLKYIPLCQSVERKKKEQDAEEKRIAGIKAGIDSNLLYYSTEIAGCDTTGKLLAVERKLNLEKGRKEKYQEFLPQFVEKAIKLTELITEQKSKVKELEEVIAAKNTAIENEDDGTAIELLQKEEQITNSIADTKVIVQETAINQATQSQPSFAQEILPTVKSRKTWKFEIVDKAKAFKADMVIIEIDPAKAKATLQVLKDTNQLDGKEELIVNGVKYYLERKF